MTAGVRDRPLVADVVKGRIRTERGSIPLKGLDKVALVAQFSTTATQTRSLSAYLNQLDAAGFLPVIISTCEADEPLEFPYGLPDSTVIVRRPNLGYDFGSWATGLGSFPQIRRANRVLLTNDSLLGPFADISFLLDWACTPGPDIRAMTTSYQIVRHLQSFFLCFHNGILDDAAWRVFFNKIRVEPTKDDVVINYELGLSRHAFEQAYSWDSYISAPELKLENGNPTIEGWRELVEAGIPFVKRTMLTHPAAVEQAPAVIQFVKQRFHTDIREW